MSAGSHHPHLRPGHQVNLGQPVLATIFIHCLCCTWSVRLEGAAEAGGMMDHKEGLPLGLIVHECLQVAIILAYKQGITISLLFLESFLQKRGSRSALVWLAIFKKLLGYQQETHTLSTGLWTTSVGQYARQC